MGAGQSVAILQFGGGLDLVDNAKFYEENKLTKPQINIIEVSGAHNSPGSTDDDEVTMDSQIIGSIAPDAKQNLIFSQDTEKGWIDAITRATFPEKGEAQNSVISISWGDPEARWTDEQRRAQGLAFKKAALKGISVFAASGDDGAKDGSKDGKFTTDYPSSDPYVTASGGTNLTTDADGRIKREVTWNDNDGAAGGGGISDNIALPFYQKGLAMPANANNNNRRGRGVPDMSADASPQTGYIIRTHGVEEISGGTSAVSPLFAALTLRINGALGHNVGFLNPFIYKNGSSGIFHDITEGNNDGYNATPGWDAATGWGSLDGQKLLDALRKQ
jgi:kumamolisin